MCSLTTLWVHNLNIKPSPLYITINEGIMTKLQMVTAAIRYTSLTA